jgi:hypothetical protein
MPKLPYIDYQVQAPLSTSVTLNNDQNTPATIFSIDATVVKSAIVEYSVIRASTVEVGRIFITSDGTTLSFEVDAANNVDTGISLFGTMSGSTILAQYMSTNTGQTGTFRYSQRTLN